MAEFAVTHSVGHTRDSCVTPVDSILFSAVSIGGGRGAMSAIKCSLCNNVIYLKEKSSDFMCFNDGCPVVQYQETEAQKTTSFIVGIIFFVAFLVFINFISHLWDRLFGV